MSDAANGTLSPMQLTLSVGLLAAPLLAFLGLDLTGSSNAILLQAPAKAEEPASPPEKDEEEADKKAEKSASDSDRLCAQRFWKALNKFLTLHPTSEPRNGLSPFRLHGDGDDPSKNEILISLLPDPLDSGLDYAFDTQLQALRLGIETPTKRSETYQRMGDWLPWDDRHGGDDQHEQSARCRGEVPGFLVYQKVSAEPGKRSEAEKRAESKQLVLIVGESPVNGPHRRALQRAIELARTATKPLKILGPSFSGSAELLHRTLGDTPARIVSATANGPNVKLLKEGTNREFFATTVPQSAIECAFLHFAMRRGERSSAAGDGPGCCQGTELEAACCERAKDRPACCEEGGAPRILQEVAILTEADTSFGRETSATGCRFTPRLDLTFPLQISTLQKEYERLDEAGSATAGRRTMLDARLLGSRRKDIERQLSAVTKYAQDHALANLLSRISREGIRFLGIRATNVVDAIFLARKVRDVAPDVRLAFFESDALLLHPEYHRHLLGSLVVSPYPFLGADDFAINVNAKHRHHPFESSGAIATFNAVLALRGAEPSEMKEYLYPAQENRVLPIWLSALGRSGLQPLRMIAPVDCDKTIYKGADTPKELCGGTGVPREARMNAWRAFNKFSQSPITHGDLDVPHLWYFVLALLLLVALLDFTSQRRTLKAIGHIGPWCPLPSDLSESDRMLDLHFASAQWRLFAFLRRLCLLIATAYMAAIHHLSQSTAAFTPAVAATVLLIDLPVLFLCLWTSRGLWRYLETFSSYRRVVRNLPKDAFPKTSGRSSFMAWLGFGTLRDRATTIQRSYAHLLWTFSSCVAAALVFVGFLGAHILASTDFGSFEFRPGEILSMAKASADATAQGAPLSALRSQLFVLRSMPLLNGLSPVVPLLLCLAAIYVWTVGRCARTMLLRSLTTMCPSDEVLDGVSTPLCTVLYPDKGDGGFTRQERSLANALSRPSGGSYMVTLAVIAVLPGVLFVLKRPSTLESHTGLMFTALGLMAVLTGVTLLQLLQYWRALDLVLKRIMTHPLGPAFQRVQSIVREGVDAQVSRIPNDLLRLVGCAQSFETLVVLDRPRLLDRGIDLRAQALPPDPAEAGDPVDGMGRLPPPPLLPEASKPVRKHIPFESLEACSRSLARACDDTLAAMSEQDVTRQAMHQEKLGTEVVVSARSMMEVLAAGRKGLATAAGDPRATLRLSAPPPPDEAPSNASVASWLMRVESYVATVVALLLNRHVRQFRIFLYTSVASAVLLLLAIASYPFEPHRTLFTCIALVMGAVVFTCMYVYVQLDRDPLLNHIAGTPEQAGHLTLNSSFIVRVVLWVVIPLLSVLAAQYPELANLAGSVEPFTRALR